jgi:hypothetical protein
MKKISSNSNSTHQMINLNKKAVSLHFCRAIRENLSPHHNLFCNLLLSEESGRADRRIRATNLSRIRVSVLNHPPLLTKTEVRTPLGDRGRKIKMIMQRWYNKKSNIRWWYLNWMKTLR